MSPRHNHNPFFIALFLSIFKINVVMICEYLKKILPLDGDNLSTAATTAAAATVTAAAAVVGGGFLGW
jgi:hypothetical protein